MPQQKPVAENLLETKIFGLPVREILYAYGVPMAPAMFALFIGVSTLLTTVFIIFGLTVGTFVWVKTPDGQLPQEWLFATIKFYAGPTAYDKQPVDSAPDEDDIIEDRWETKDVDGSYRPESPEDIFPTRAMVEDTNTIERIDFKHVRDNGVIEIEDGFAILIEIDPIAWLIKDNESKEAVEEAYAQVLNGLQYPIQIFTLPVPYSSGKYRRSIQEAQRNRGNDESEIISHGREEHLAWLQQILRGGKIKDRRHFIAVKARRDSIDIEGSTGLFDDIFGSGSASNQQEIADELINECWSRARSLSNSLPKTGVQTSILDDREEVLNVLHYYYKTDSLHSSQEFSTLTEREGGELDISPESTGGPGDISATSDGPVKADGGAGIADAEPSADPEGDSEVVNDGNQDPAEDSVEGDQERDEDQRVGLGDLFTEEDQEDDEEESEELGEFEAMVQAADDTADGGDSSGENLEALSDDGGLSSSIPFDTELLNLFSGSSTEDSDWETGGLTFDELTGSEISEAVDHLDSLGMESHEESILWAAHQMREGRSEQMVSALETAEERGRVDRSVVAPNNVEESHNYHTRDGNYHRILTATGLPRRVTAGWLVQLTLAEEDIRVSTHIKPHDKENIRDKIQSKITQARSTIEWKKEKGRTDVHEEKHELQELERMLNKIIQGTTKLFEVSIYIEVVGDTKEELDAASREVTRRLNEQGLEMTPLQNRQDEATGSVAPVATDSINNSSTMQLGAVATMFNFVEPAVNMDGGVLYGFDRTGRPVILDRYGLSGHSKVVTGKIGSGKSFAVKTHLWRRLLKDQNIRSIIFDPLGDDFPDFARKMGGEVIRFGGEHKVNPLQITPPKKDQPTQDLYMVKVRNVMEILKTYLEDRAAVGAEEEGVLMTAIHYAYLKKGITDNPETFHRESPILEDVIEGLNVLAEGGVIEEDLYENAEVYFPAETDGVMTAKEDGEHTAFDKFPDDHAVETIRAPPDEHQVIAGQLVPKLESFRGNNVNSNLNGHTNLELDSDIVVFDMSSFADTGQTPLFLHVMLNWAYEQAKQSDRRTDVTFEEAHYLLRHDGARDLLNLFIRHARHFDSGLTLISQTIDEFLKTEERMEIYDNCDIKQMFYMENVSERVKEYFSLSEDEARFLRRAAQGENTNYSECLLSTSDHGRRRLEVSPSPFTRHICDSDADPWLWLAQNDRLRPADVDELVNEDPDTVLSVDQARQLARPGAGPPAETVAGGPIAGNQEG